MQSEGLAMVKEIHEDLRRSRMGADHQFTLSPS